MVARVFLYAFVLMLVLSNTAEACSVCYGDPSSPLNQAMASGIWLLLGCIGTVLSGFAGLFCYWAMRVRRLRTAGEGEYDLHE